MNQNNIKFNKESLTETYLSIFNDPYISLKPPIFKAKTCKSDFKLTFGS